MFFPKNAKKIFSTRFGRPRCRQVQFDLTEQFFYYYNTDQNKTKLQNYRKNNKTQLNPKVGRYLLYTFQNATYLRLGGTCGLFTIFDSSAVIADTEGVLSHNTALATNRNRARMRKFASTRSHSHTCTYTGLLTHCNGCNREIARESRGVRRGWRAATEWSAGDKAGSRSRLPASPLCPPSGRPSPAAPRPRPRALVNTR